MATRDSVMGRARRKAAATRERFCEEIRLARTGLGLSQAAAAARAGMSRSAWTRYEAGERDPPSWDVAARMAAAVGLDLVTQLSPSEMVVRDGPQLDLLRDLRDVLGPAWSWRYEVPVAAAPDQRAWDAVARHRQTAIVIHVDAETRIADCQRVVRRLRSKADGASAERVVLAVRDTTRNRHAIGAAEAIIAAELPVPMRSAVRALRLGRDPGGDVLIVIRRRTATRPRARRAILEGVRGD
jgi:transcriptional regulator with XRE-family HTH domain